MIRTTSMPRFVLWIMLPAALIFITLITISYSEIRDAELAFEQQGQAAARTNLLQAYDELQRRATDAAESFINSDETRQQFNNLQYYVYWRDNRAKEYRGYLSYMVAVELYNVDKNALAREPLEGFPGFLESGNAFYINNESGSFYLYQIVDVPNTIRETGIKGYMVVKYDVLDYLVKDAHIPSINTGSISFAVSEALGMDSLQELMPVTVFTLVARTDVEKLIDILSENLLTLGVLVPVISAIILLVFTYVLVAPIRRFSSLVHDLGDQKLQNPEDHAFRFDELQNIWKAILEYRDAVRQMNTNLDIKNQELWELAHHDPLTSCYNRRAFEEDWHQMMLMLENRRFSVTMMLFDCDRFKLLNDTYGHAVGDQVLIHVSRVIQGKLREGDRLYRLGGDEFCTLLLGCDQNEARAIAKRCLDELAQTQGDLNIPDPVRISIGIAATSGAELDSLHNLQRQADTAMYYAKRPNNKSMAVYDPEMFNDSLTLLNNKLITVVYDSIAARSGLVLYFQPIYHLHNYRIEYYEVLARMEHEGELLRPDDFLSIIQDRHIDPEFDLLVIDTLSAALKSNVIEHGRGVSINISGVGIIDKRVITQLGTLTEYIDDHPITIEITETSLITRLSRASSYISRLQGQGFKVSLDDFGSGYSSLGYLTQMPVNTIKFDISLIQSVFNSPKEAVIVRSLADMCIKAGFDIVAEGVEDMHMLDTVHDMGFTYAQGYYIGKPDAVPLTDVVIDNDIELAN